MSVRFCRIKIYKKNSFYSIVRSSEPLGLIHSGIDDLKFMQTKREKSITLLLYMITKVLLYIFFFIKNDKKIKVIKVIRA